MALGALAAGLAVLGTGLQIGGSLMQGSAQRKLAEMNAQIARMNAQAARLAAAEDARIIRRHGRQVVSEQLTGFAKSEIDVTSGTVADLARATTFGAELDALKREYEGELQARGFEHEAALSIYQGRLAQRAGIINAISAGTAGALQLTSAFQRGRVDTSGSSAPLLQSVFTPSSSLQSQRLLGSNYVPSLTPSIGR